MANTAGPFGGSVARVGGDADARTGFAGGDFSGLVTSPLSGCVPGLTAAHFGTAGGAGGGAGTGPPKKKNFSRASHAGPDVFCAPSTKKTMGATKPAARSLL